MGHEKISIERQVQLLDIKSLTVSELTKMCVEVDTYLSKLKSLEDEEIELERKLKEKKKEERENIRKKSTEVEEDIKLINEYNKIQKDFIARANSKRLKQYLENIRRENDSIRYIISKNKRDDAALIDVIEQIVFVRYRLAYVREVTSSVRQVKNIFSRMSLKDAKSEMDNNDNVMDLIDLSLSEKISLVHMKQLIASGDMLFLTKISMSSKERVLVESPPQCIMSDATEKAGSVKKPGESPFFGGALGQAPTPDAPEKP